MKKIVLLFLIIGLINANSKAQNCTNPTAKNTLDINNVNTMLMDGGDMWWDQGLQIARYEIPKGSGNSVEFLGALWLGGYDQSGQLHLAAQTWRQSGTDYFAGPLDINGNVTAGQCTDYDKIWKVNATDIQFHISNTNRTLANTPTSILEWPAFDNPYAKGNSGVTLIINQNLAPFIDVDGIAGYNPLNGDYPKICGDQALWWVFNDNGNAHTETNGLPLMVEVQVMAYAFIGGGQENNTTYYSYKIINKSTNTYDSTIFSFFNDADLGCASDDYIGCDVSRNMSISYNADANDQACPNGYGITIPMTGVGLVQAPLDINGNPVKMSSFTYFFNSSPTALADPQGAANYYGYMTGTWRDGTHFTQGGNAHGGTINTNYVYTDAPNKSGTNATTGQPYWSMCNPTPITPGDLRTVMSFGPLHFAPGQSQTITIAATTVLNVAYPCPSFQPIQQAMDYAKTFFISNSCDQVLGNPASTNDLKSNKNQMSVYPNPATDKLFIVNSNPSNGNSVVINDILGRTCIAILNQKTETINIESLNKGIYFIKLIDANASVSITKLIKE
jgi:hypothetical protein